MNFAILVVIAILAVAAYFKFFKKPKATAPVAPPRAVPVAQPNPVNVSPPASAPSPTPAPVATPAPVNTANLPIDPWAGKTVAQLEVMYAAQVIKVKEFDAEREKLGFGGPTVTGDPHYVLAAIGTHISHAKKSPNGLSPPSDGYRAP